MSDQDTQETETAAAEPALELEMVSVEQAEEEAAEARAVMDPAQQELEQQVADQLADVTKGIATILDHDGVFIFEVSYLLDIIDNFVFDTVYHEHLSYHSIDPFKRFFSKHGLHLFDIQRNLSKGGSFRGFVQKADGAKHEKQIVQEMIEEETRRGLHGPKIFHEFEKRVLVRKDAVLEFEKF